MGLLFLSDLEIGLNRRINKYDEKEISPFLPYEK
jgi:hypothetical protein